MVEKFTTRASSSSKGMGLKSIQQGKRRIGVLHLHWMHILMGVARNFDFVVNGNNSRFMSQPGQPL